MNALFYVLSHSRTTYHQKECLWVFSEITKYQRTKCHRIKAPTVSVYA